MAIKRAQIITTDTVQTAWQTMLSERHYPASKFLIKERNQNGDIVGTHPLDWEQEQKQIKADNEAFFKLDKNKKFLGSKITFVVITLHQPWRYYSSPQALIDVLDKFKKYAEYIFFGYEVGKTGDTEHLQGYIRFKYEMRLKNSEICSKFGTVNIHIEKARGDDVDNFYYTMKDENPSIDKWTYQYGNMTDIKLVRKRFNCSDYVDYVIKNNILITEETMDFYCADYRKNPSKAKSTIVTLYSARMRLPYTALQHLTFCGASRSGKSLISRYLVLRTGIDFPRDVMKQEASGSEKKMWFNNDVPIKRICWISEMNYGFPTKANLLSILDKESGLPVKGKDAVPNFFDILLLNSTNITPYTIYNITQWIKTSYQEIAYRLLEQGSTYFVFPNPEWTAISQSKRQKMLVADYCGTVRQYPPVIYKNTTPTIPEYDSQLNFEGYELRDSYHIQFDTYFELLNDTTIVEHVIKRTSTKVLYQTANTYSVQRVTLDDVEADFIARLQLVNSPLLNNYGHPKSITAKALKDVQQKLTKSHPANANADDE